MRTLHCLPRVLMIKPKVPSTGHGPFIASPCHLLALICPHPPFHTVLSSVPWTCRFSLLLAISSNRIILPSFLYMPISFSPFRSQFRCHLSSEALADPLLSAATSHPYLLAHCPIQTSQHRSLSDFILLIYASVIWPFSFIQ